MAIRKSIASGTKFNFLTFLSNSPDLGGRRSGLFRCDCGAEKVMLVSNFFGGKSKSCGCVSRQKTIERSTKHGHAKRGAHTRAYGSWENMVSRCTLPSRPDYHRYGGRGIKVCGRWLESFENFIADMGDPPHGTTLDRYPDANGNYEPGNVRWATPKEQANNRRSNVIIEYAGKKQNIEAWANELGISRATIEGRLNRGLTDAGAIFSASSGPRVFTHDGKTLTTSEWAKELGVSHKCINERIRRGWLPEKIFSR